MKIIHCADLHLDSKFDYLPTIKANQRREEILHTFERLCDYAYINNVCAVIISGDLFDTSKVSKKTLDRVVFAIQKYAEIKFIYLSGNHDEKIENIDFSVFPINFVVIGNTFSRVRLENVVIGGISLDNGNIKSFYEQISFSEYDFNILALHGQVADYKANAKSQVISLPNLKDRNINYLALGHYHSYSVGKIDERGAYVYSGCLDGRGFDEIGEKGFVLIDTENLENPYEFIEFSSKKYLEIQFSVTGMESWVKARAELLKQLSDLDYNSIVKIVIVGEHDTDFFIDAQELLNALSSIFFFAKIEDKTRLSITFNDYKNDKSLRGEFIKAVWESDLDEQEKKQIITCGLNALKGGEII